MTKLAKTTDESIRETARISAVQAKASRVSRTRKTERGITTLGATGGEGKRLVYDSQNTTEMRKELVREDGGIVTGDAVADRVFDFAGTVRDFYRRLERNSIDGNGMDIIMNIHYGQNYMNAFWDGDEMTFGEGDGQIFSDFTDSLDVVAHELTHGVTQHTANLDYYSQSGALNEHFSDVFGSAIQQAANGQDAGQADWLIGNELMGPTLYGESLRSMMAPGSAYQNDLLGVDPQPAHMRDYYDGPADNRGVHINSGIPNRAFYLVATDIGTDKAVQIWYQGLRMLWPTADFNDAVDVLANAARTLTLHGKVSEGSTQTVRLAFKDVGLPV